MTYAISGGETYLASHYSPRMRRVRGNSRGLSEIVGTLILILIVVAAATALSVFVTGYEKTLLSQEATTHEKSLESYKVFGITIPETTGSPPPTPLGYYVFDVASTTVESSAITSMLINDQPVLWYCALPPSAIPTNISDCTGAGGLGGQWVSLGSSLAFTPLEQYKIVVNYDDDQGGFQNPYCSSSNSYATCSAFNTSLTTSGLIVPTGSLRIDLFTLYDNDFVQVSLAPIAIAAVTTLNVPGSSTVVTVLDGEASIQPGSDNDSIASWEWAVVDTTNPGVPADNPPGPLSGEEIPIANISNGGWVNPGDTYSITLTVVDGTGLYNSDLIYWTAP